jgi:hypothetical protein
MNTPDPNDPNSLDDKTALPTAQPPPSLAVAGRDATLDEFNRAAERVAAAYRQALSELQDE